MRGRDPTLAVISFAQTHRLPTIGDHSGFARTGGLLAYSANEDELWRRAVGYVDRLLRGATPADLPVEQATKVDFVINRQTAAALNLTIPPAVLVQATEVIQ